ncbi:asparaginase [Microbispora sp. NEAU-D428]|uniref:asparaginase n=1 Tax=Microbispora sitophila TaxID=2771537 RepID=UPI001865D10C|nr:asparaginase [Microbispora sitophila]MBE3014147.1 asparaginase [Microbispora sitophila]
MTRLVRVLTTGGTIASLPAPGGVSVGVAGRDLVTGVETDVTADVTVEVREVMLRHSFALTRADVAVIARRVLAELDDPRVSGVVVTHGTDTMEETAYLLDLVHPGERPVVFTGAQRNAAEPDRDGPRNLSDAIRLAADPAARGLGSVIVMAGAVHAARHAVKAHTVALDAFASPGYGAVGQVLGGRVRVVARPVRPPGFALAELGELEPRVDIVPVHLDADGVQMNACAAAGARGLVLEALGTGNPTPGVLRAVRSCVTDGIVVLVTSRCRQGPAVPVYGGGGGADLAAAGAVFAGTLAAPKARILLTAALAADPRPGMVLDRLRPHLSA